MIVTEAQAKTLWCPLVRMAYFDKQGAASGNCDVEANGTINRNPVDSHCIASDCMCWVWVSTHTGPERTGCCGVAHRRIGGDV